MSRASRHGFYRDVLRTLEEAGLPFLVGGAFAMRHYAGVRRDTKDLDLFIDPGEARRAVRVLSDSGFEARIVAPHWLGKVVRDDAYVDLIFSSRNGLCVVDAAWFARAEPVRLLGRTVRLVPPEEMIWSKAFVMARDRFDGGDIAQLLRERGRSLDWDLLLARFGPHWPVLFVHVVLFSYTFPSERGAVPNRVRAELERRWRKDRWGGRRICRGPLLSPPEYLQDIGPRGYLDVRRPDVKREGA